jgi:PilZ domain
VGSVLKQEMDMSNNYSGPERREFFRYRFEKTINYKKVAGPKGNKDGSPKLTNAVSKDLSASGLLFSTDSLPELSSLLVLDLDYRTTLVCQEIEEKALIVNNKLLGKVVRIEDTDDGRYDVGVAFIKKSEDLPNEIKNLLKADS